MSDKLGELATTIKRSMDKKESGYSKAVAYSLGGEVLNENGEISKTDFFKFLDLKNTEDYADITLTAEEADKFRKSIQAMSTGVQAVVPLRCPGKDICKFASHCELAKMNKAPVGRMCLPEAELITFFRKKFITEYEVIPSNATDMGLVNELAELEIYEMRCNMSLSKPEAQDLTQEDMVGASNTGEPLYQKKVHVSWEIKERIKVRKMKLLEALVGTRKEKYKRAAALKTRDTGDPSTSMSNMRSTLEGLQDEMTIVKSDMAKDISPE